MANGTLLTVFAPTAPLLAQIENEINTLGLPNELKESTFFVQVGDITDYDNIVAFLRGNGVTFTAVFLNDTIGSALRTGNISPAETNNINLLLCLP